MPEDTPEEKLNLQLDELTDNIDSLTDAIWNLTDQVRDLCSLFREQREWKPQTQSDQIKKADDG